MTKGLARISEVVVPMYVPDNLGAPFKVVLTNSVRQLKNLDTGEIIKTIIPNPRGLLESIAVTRLVWPRKLSGADIKFIRKSLKLKASDLAHMIEVSPEHLSRCEAGERVLSPGVEKCLRMAILVDLLTLPNSDQENHEENSCDQQLISKFSEVISRLKVVIRGMTIPSVYDSEEDLCLTFHVKKSGRHATNDRDEEEDWSGEDAALAA